MTKARLRFIAEHAAKTKDEAAVAMLTECVEAIQHLQSYTRRGIEPEPQNLPVTAKVKSAPDPRVTEFIDEWDRLFTIRFKEKYKVQGVKDAMAVKRLLATKATVDQLLDLAWEAWKHTDKFNCKAAVTMLGFEQRFNDIRIELKTLANGNRPERTTPAGVTL